MENEKDDLLKESVERLNDLYFKLNGMYIGVVASLGNNNVRSKEVEFLLENLDPQYIGKFLDEVDEYVIKKINHGLLTDSYLCTLETLNYSKVKESVLHSKVLAFSKAFSKELSELEEQIYSIDSKIPGFNTCCEEMRSVLNQIEESVYLSVGASKESGLEK